jgi:hypothetical protein
MVLNFRHAYSKEAHRKPGRKVDGQEEEERIQRQEEQNIQAATKSMSIVYDT